MQGHLKEPAIVTVCFRGQTYLSANLTAFLESFVVCWGLKDAMERLPRLVHTSDYYPPLIFQVGTNDTKDNLGTIK